MTRLPDESTILRFRHFLEAHQIHSVSTTAANAHDVTQAAALLHGQRCLFADSGYRGVSKRPVMWQA